MKSLPEEPSTKVVGIPWYSPETYDKLRAEMQDPEALPATFEEWLQQAQGAERQLCREGCTVVRVDLTLSTFRAYCLRRGLPLNSGSRVRFATESATRHG